MTKLVLIVLILSFGSYSHVELLDESLNSVMLKQADFQAVEFPEIFGLEPKFPSTLNIVGQTAPIFAGAKTIFFYQSGKTQGWHRQKEKLTGYISRRMEVIPLAAKFSGGKITPHSTSHAT